MEEIMVPPKLIVGNARLVLVDEPEFGRLIGRRGVRHCLAAAERAAGLLSQQMRLLRRKAGLSQAELAKRAGVRPKTVAQIECGEFNGAVSTIKRLLRAMGLDPEKA